MANYDVFISYSRKDTAVADRICAALDGAGITYFIDRQGIGGGMEFPVVLARAIVESKLFLYLASCNSYESKFTNSEITFAFNEKPKNSLLPYVIDGSDLPLEMKFIFSGINWRNTTDHPIDTVLVADICRLLGRPDKSSQQESPEALYQQGRRFFDQEDYDGAVPLLRRAAEQGNADAQNDLGECYLWGNGVEEDYHEAEKWFLKAAEQGNTSAKGNLDWLGVSVP